MSTARPPSPARDADRTRGAILAAATRLFATRGFEATTVGEVAAAARVARGTPSYFFGSKEGLWKAVLDTQSRAALEVVPRALARAGAARDAAGLVDALVDSCLDFAAEYPEFFRLLQWSGLQGNTLIDEVGSHWEAVASAVRAVVLVASGTATAEEDPRQAVMSVIGLCYAHLAFGPTLARPLGVDVSDPAFLTGRRAHLKRLLVAALA